MDHRLIGSELMVMEGRRPHMWWGWVGIPVPSGTPFHFWEFIQHEL